MTHVPSSGFRRPLALLQGLYYLVSGVWPLVSMRSFEAVTGPKRDHWLVRTVGVLAIGYGALLAREAASRRPAATTGLVPALGFGAVSLWYWPRGRVGPAYLLDGLAEAGFAVGWAASRAARPAPHGPDDRP